MALSWSRLARWLSCICRLQTESLSSSETKVRESAFLARYEVRQVGGREILEYWIPAEDLEEFNRHIVGEIGVVQRFRLTLEFREKGEFDAGAGMPAARGRDWGRRGGG